ncbi:DUF5696 domain-containing protein [Paenibacillus sp. GCM10027626]|uniref:DUF5696 domain-containing protein n=1 Tax=Paenibacillus sp. GCM10027626 TaxID=3273411 RepID=UPI003634A107
MVVKRLKIAVGLLLLAALGLYMLFNQSEKAEFSMAAAQGSAKDIVVNDGSGPCTEPAAGTAAIPSSFKKAAESGQLELYLEEESVAIAVKDKCNGYAWFSYNVDLDMQKAGYSPDIIGYIKSGVSIVTYDKFKPGRRTILGDQAKKTFQFRDDGFTATIDFTKVQLKFDVVVTLKQGDLIIEIPRESIQEYNPALWKPGNNDILLSEMIVYPFFGSVPQKENGYIVIPDGSGAIVRLDETPKYATGYSAPVYGQDYGYETTGALGPKHMAVKPLERVSLPIYGMIHDEGRVGMLVIAEDGASYATYNYVSKNLQTSDYQSYFTYNYRKAYAQMQSRVNKDQYVLGFQQLPNQFDLVQRYVFLSGAKADYVGVAKGFRDYLAKKDGLSKKTEADRKQIPLKIDFINNEVTMGTLGTENVPATKYRQAQELVKTLIEKGYQNLNVTFKTFVKEDSGYRFKVMDQLGGEDAFKEAIADFHSRNVRFSYYIDYAQSYYEKTKYTASKLNRQDMQVMNDSKLLYNYPNNPKYVQYLAERDLDALKKYNIGSLALGGLTETLFTHYDQGMIGYANEGMAYMEQALQDLNDNGIRTGIYLPDAYLYKYAGEYYDTPIVSSDLIFIDATVPLIPLILSGYVDMFSPYMNFSSNDTDVMLRMIEFGVFPSFILTGESTYDIKRTASNDVYASEYPYLQDRIDYMYAGVNEALHEVSNSEMIHHTILAEGVVRVEYANGKTIVINYNNESYSDGNVKIKAKGFVIL